MKRIFKVHHLSIILVILFGLMSCGESNKDFRLEGKFKNINQGEFYIYDLETGRKDTIGLNDGKFSYRTPMADTIVLTLLFPNYSELPIFAQPGAHLKIEGDVSHLKETTVTGTDDNKQMTDFRLETADMMPPAVIKKAEKFILDHPQSPVSLYLLRRYFLQSIDVDFSKAYQLCNRLLEARPTDLSLLQLQKRLGAMKQYRSSGTLPHFSAKDTNGKLVTDSLLNAKANVIMVWASWNQDSQGILRRLHQLRKEHPKDINVVSICVDASPSEGAYVLRYDSIQWPNICDGQLWDSPVMTQLGISFVPDNIVIDKKRKIVGRSLRGEQLVEKIESLLKE